MKAGGESSRKPLPKGLVRIALLRLSAGMVGIGAIIIVPAGSLAFWNAWLFLGTFLVLLLASFFLLILRDPDLLERRMRLKERESTQKKVLIPFMFLIIAIFVLPGLDFRFGWSRVPLWAVILATALLSASYALLIVVLRYNSWASRVIEVNEGQKVIDTGPYAVVRHPMYLASIGIFVFMPLVLGSWWTLIPAFLLIPFYQIRLVNEEELLSRELPGYADYLAKVRWRVIPGIW